MRVSDTENTAFKSDKRQLDPKVARLLESLEAKFLTLQKITLSEQKPISLQLLTQTLPAPLQIQLPISMVGQLSFLTQNTFNVRLSVINNQLVLEFVPFDKLHNNPSSAIKLLFNQALLTTPSVLKLSQPIIPNELMPAGSSKNSLTEPTLAQTPQAITLKQAINELLGKLPDTIPSLAKSINQLINLQQKLVTSMKAFDNSGDRIFTKLSPEATLELINKAVGASINANKLGSPQQIEANSLLNKVLQTVNQLRDNLKGENNKLENIALRIASSGVFNESNLRKLTNEGALTDPHSSLFNKLNSVGQNDNRPPIIAQDLKLFSLQLRQLVEALISNLNSTGAAPVVVRQLINLLMQSSILQNPMTSSQPAQSASTSQGLVPSGSQQLTPNAINFVNQELTQLFNSTEFIKQMQLSKMNPQHNQIILNQQRLLLTEVLQESTHILNKIENNQLLSMKNESAQLQQFLLDLPFQNQGKIDSFELLLESEKQQDKKSAKVWVVTVKFDLEPLGPMYAKIKLRNQRISTTFIAQDPQTSQLLADNMEHLKDSLLAAGLKIDQVKGQQGKVPSNLIIDNDKSIDIRV